MRQPPSLPNSFLSVSYEGQFQFQGKRVFVLSALPQDSQLTRQQAASLARRKLRKARRTHQITSQKEWHPHNHHAPWQPCEYVAPLTYACHLLMHPAVCVTSRRSKDVRCTEAEALQQKGSPAWRCEKIAPPSWSNRICELLTRRAFVWGPSFALLPQLRAASPTRCRIDFSSAAARVSSAMRTGVRLLICFALEEHNYVLFAPIRRRRFLDRICCVVCTNGRGITWLAFF